MKQLLLKGSGYSGRGIRVTVLSSSQVDTIREQSARAMSSVDADATPEARQQVWVSAQKRLGIAAMVMGITEKGGFATKDELLPKEVVWTAPTADELTDHPEKYFTTKDLDALGDIYFRLHVANPKEVEDILGEALDVTAE